KAVNRRIVLRNLQDFLVGIISEGANASSPASQGKQYVAFNQCLLGTVALSKIDDDGNQTQGLVTLIVDNEAARLYPPDLTVVSAQDAKLRNEFTLLLEKRLVARCVQCCQIVRMHKFAGAVAPHLEAAFR